MFSINKPTSLPTFSALVYVWTYSPGFLQQELECDQKARVVTARPRPLPSSQSHVVNQCTALIEARTLCPLQVKEAIMSTICLIFLGTSKAQLSFFFKYFVNGTNRDFCFSIATRWSSLHCSYTILKKWKLSFTCSKKILSILYILTASLICKGHSVRASMRAVHWLTTWLWSGSKARVEVSLWLPLLSDHVLVLVVKIQDCKSKRKLRPKRLEEK